MVARFKTAVEWLLSFITLVLEPQMSQENGKTAHHSLQTPWNACAGKPFAKYLTCYVHHVSKKEIKYSCGFNLLVCLTDVLAA